MKTFKTVPKNIIFGFSLIEVLIFLTIISLFLIIAITITVQSLHNLKLTEYKILASYYTQEAFEWLKIEKETDWNAFINKSSINGTTYCLNNGLNLNSASPCGNNDFSLGNFFKREVTLKKLTDIQNNYYVNIKITLFWRERNDVNQIKIESSLNQWE